MKYIYLSLLTIIAIFLFAIISNQNESKEYQRQALIKFSNINYNLVELKEQIAKTAVNDSLTVELLETLADLKECK